MATVVEFENPDLPASTGRSQGVAKTGAKKKAKNDKTPSDGRNGRPLADINWVQVEKMANFFTPIPEIVAILGHDLRTFERQCKAKFNTTFAVWWKSKAAPGKMSIRRTLFTEAVGYENQGALRNPDGSYLQNSDGDAVMDPKPSRRPNMQALLYMAKWLLDMEGVAPVYDPEHDEDAEDENEGSSTVYPIKFVGSDADEVAETPAPGAEAELADDDDGGFPDATGLKPYDPANPPAYYNADDE